MSNILQLNDDQYALLVETLTNACDEGPAGEGYQSEALSKLSAFVQHEVMDVNGFLFMYGDQDG